MERPHGAGKSKLMLVAEYGGDTMLPRIGMVRARHRAGSPGPSEIKISPLLDLDITVMVGNNSKRRLGQRR